MNFLKQNNFSTANWLSKDKPKSQSKFHKNSHGQHIKYLVPRNKDNYEKKHFQANSSEFLRCWWITIYLIFFILIVPSDYRLSAKTTVCFLNVASGWPSLHQKVSIFSPAMTNNLKEREQQSKLTLEEREREMRQWRYNTTAASTLITFIYQQPKCLDDLDGFQPSSIEQPKLSSLRSGVHFPFPRGQHEGPEATAGSQSPCRELQSTRTTPS